MIRRHGAALRASLMVADALSAWLVFVVVSVVRFGSHWEAQWTSIGLEPRATAVAYAAAWTATLFVIGMYRIRARWSWRREWLDVLRAACVLGLASLAVLFVVKLPDVSRLFLVELFAVQLAVTIASRALVRRLYATSRARGLNGSFVLVVGSGQHARDFASRLEANRALGMRVVGFLRDPKHSDSHEPAGRGPRPARQMGEPGARDARGQPLVLGDIDQLEDVLHATVVDEVIICLPPESIELVEPITRLCEEEGKVVRIPLEPVRIALTGGEEDSFDGIPVLSLVYGPDRAVALILKRLIDVVGAVAALVVLSPVLAVVALLILVDGGRPVIYTQERVGRHGRPFRLYKFRSMEQDADDRLRELAALNEIQGHAFKLTDDPRITRVGRMLRRTSIDELPQFWNVLRGDMSIVGPRPPLPSEVQNYDIWHRRRLAMKPGITGLWQVSARHEADFDQWVRLDIDYIDRWSLLLDTKIMLRTVPALLQGR